MKHFLLGVFLLSSIAFLGYPAYIFLGIAIISFVIWLITSHSDVLQILAFQKSCLVMGIIAVVIIIGRAYEFYEKMNTGHIEIYMIYCLLFFVIGYLVSTIKIRRIQSHNDKSDIIES